jgi:hypothetical protein
MALIIFSSSHLLRTLGFPYSQCLAIALPVALAYSIDMQDHIARLSSLNCDAMISASLLCFKRSKLRQPLRPAFLEDILIEKRPSESK